MSLVKGVVTKFKEKNVTVEGFDMYTTSDVICGGGFAGTIQAFVPTEMIKEYKDSIERIFGDGSCHQMKIRPVGGIEIL